MSDYGQYFDPRSVRDLAFSILKAEGRTPNGKSWSIRDLCILLDWMHKHIRYERDEALYGQRHYVATPKQTLKHKRGDCEDHALLYGSLCMAIGASVRMAVVPGHAFTEVCLGKKSTQEMSAVKAEISRYLDDKSQDLGMKKGRYLLHQGKVAQGWRKANGGYEKTGGSCHYWPRNMTGIQWVVQDSGLVYLPVDDCQSMAYIGDVKKLSEYRSSNPSEMWAEVTYYYPPARDSSAKPRVRKQSRSREPIERIPKTRPCSPRPRSRKTGPGFRPLLGTVAIAAVAGWWFDKAEWSADFCALVLGGWFLLRGWRAGRNLGGASHCGPVWHRPGTRTSRAADSPPRLGRNAAVLCADLLDYTQNLPPTDRPPPRRGQQWQDRQPDGPGRRCVQGHTGRLGFGLWR